MKQQPVEGVRRVREGAGRWRNIIKNSWAESSSNKNKPNKGTTGEKRANNEW